MTFPCENEGRLHEEYPFPRMHACLDDSLRCIGSAGLSELGSNGSRLGGSWMSGVVYCGSMGDWPLLEHHQRQEGVQKLAQAGIPVVVGTGAQNTRLAVEHVSGMLPK